MASVAVDSARKILDSSPAELFSGSEADVRDQFKKLAKIWHPDQCRDPEAHRVFQYIQRCRDIVLGKPVDGRRSFERRVGTAKFNVDFLTQHRAEFGEILVTQSNVCYLIPREFDDLVEVARKMRWSYRSKNIENAMSRHLPRSTVTEDTKEGTLMAYRRSRTQALMRDLISYEKSRGGGKVCELDVMWMVSSLLNLCCYLEIEKTSHCALTPDFLLVDLQDHSVSLTGPPLFAVPFWRRPKAVPREVLSSFPRLRSPSFTVNDSTLDLTMVRVLAMNLVGHKSHVTMRRDTSLPSGLRDWLGSPAPSSALVDYRAWEETRGKRAFHRYDGTARDVYDELRK